MAGTEKATRTTAQRHHKVMPGFLPLLPDSSVVLTVSHLLPCADMTGILVFRYVQMSPEFIRL